MFIPIILAPADIQSEVLLHLLIGTFCLSIGLWVVGSSKIRLNPKASEEVTSELGRKLRTTVNDKVQGESMETEDLLVVYVCNSL
jgi:hypothetical protein